MPQSFLSRTLVILSCLTLQLSCSKDSTIIGTQQGAYRFTAYDTTGTVLSSGVLTLDTHDSSHVSGTWNIVCTSGQHDTGPQCGSGTLAGLFSDGRLLLNLNPNYVDNNVLLTGTLQSNRYSGTWAWSGFPGIINRGAFVATR